MLNQQDGFERDLPGMGLAPLLAALCNSELQPWQIQVTLRNWMGLSCSGTSPVIDLECFLCPAPDLLFLVSDPSGAHPLHPLCPI